MSFVLKVNLVHRADAALGLSCLIAVAGCSGGSAPAGSQGHAGSGHHSGSAHSSPGQAPRPVVPVQGRLAEKWSYTGDKDYGTDTLGYDVDQHLLIESAEPNKNFGEPYNGNTQITAINPLDGTQVWRASIGPVDPAQIVSGGPYIAVVPSTGIQYNSSQAAMPVLNARSGARVQNFGLNLNEAVAGFSGENLIIEKTNRAGKDEDLVAVSPVSDKEIWTHHWGDCSPDGSAPPVADDQAIAAVLQCGHSTFVASINPVNGRQSWKRKVSDSINIDRPFGIEQGVIEYTSSTVATIFSPEGRPYTFPVKTSPWFGVDGKNVQLAYQAADGQITAKSVNIETGATLRSTTTPDYGEFSYLNSAHFSGVTADLVIGLPDPILPAAVMQVNLADGSRSFSTLPYALRLSPNAAPSGDGSMLVAAVSAEKTEGFSLTAPTGQASQARNAPQLQMTPAHWPQACSFTPRHLMSIILAGKSFITIKKSLPLQLGLPNASSCELVGRTAAANIPIFISLAWDAASARQAKEIFDNSLGGFEDNGAEGRHCCRLRGPWDEGWYGGKSYVIPDDIKFRVGRLIFDIHDAAPHPVAKILAQTITRNIHSGGNK